MDIEGRHEEGISEAGFPFEKAEDIFYSEARKVLCGSGSGKNRDVILLRKVLKEFPELLGIQIKR